MKRIRLDLALVASVCLSIAHSHACAQYSSIATPNHNVGSGYYDQLGIGFGGRIGNNVFFNNGAAGNALPPFGGNGGGGANFGFGLRGGGANLNFGLNAASGYDSNITSVTPSVTVPSGGTGAIFDGQQRPFVTGLVPMVGHFAPGVGHTMVEPRVVSPLVERLSRLEAEGGNTANRSANGSPSPSASPRRNISTAERGALSLAEIRASQTSKVDVKAAEIEALLEAARLREEAGEIGQALIDYGRAASRAEGLQRDEIRAKMRSLRAANK